MRTFGQGHAAPEAWTETDKVRFDGFLKTPTGAKLLLPLYALVTDLALSVCGPDAV